MPYALRPLLAYCLALLLVAAALPGRADAAGKLVITVVDEETGKPIPCRMHLKTANGKPRRVGKLPFWDDHFAFAGTLELELQRGNYTFELERGPEYVLRTGHFTIDNFADDTKTVELKRFVDMANDGWWSGDFNVRRPPDQVELLMQAEDLHVAQVVTSSNEPGAKTKLAPPKTPLVTLADNRFYQPLVAADRGTSGGLLFYNLTQPLTRPEARPAAKAAGADLISATRLMAEARMQPDVWIDVETPQSWDLPVFLASGNVDSICLANRLMCREKTLDSLPGDRPRDAKRLRGPWGNGLWSQEIYYHVLNCGLRLPPTAGSASGAAPNPVGYNRIYVHCGENFSPEAWWEGLRAGRVVVTNGPLMRPDVEGQMPGHVFEAETGDEISLEISLNLATRDPVSYLEVIRNGQIERSVRLDEWAKTGKLPPVTFKESGWFLLRAVTEAEKTYRFVSTGPYYVEIGDQKRRVSRKSAEFFLAWANERRAAIKLKDDEQQREAIAAYDSAIDFWQKMAEQATAE